MATFLEFPGVKAGPGKKKLGIYSTTNSTSAGENSQKRSPPVDSLSCGDPEAEAIEFSDLATARRCSQSRHPGFPLRCRLSSMELRKRVAPAEKSRFAPIELGTEP
jgi:hypothetical protein